MPVNELKIYSYTNLRITTKSFDGTVFDELRALTLSNVEVVDELNKRVRISVPPSEEMATNDSRFTFKGICNNFRDELRSLQVQDLQNNNPMAVTGNVTFKRLEMVHFRHNSFRDSIHRYVFYNMKSVKKLTMANCNIEYIWNDAFHYLSTNTEYIDLTNNKMTRLTSGIFNVFLHKDRQMRILLDGNPWLCDCTDITDIFERIPCLEKSSNKCLYPSTESNRPKNVGAVEGQVGETEQNQQSVTVSASPTTPAEATSEVTSGPTLESTTEPTPTPTPTVEKRAEDKLEDELEDEQEERLKREETLKKEEHLKRGEEQRVQEDRLREKERLRHEERLRYRYENRYMDGFGDEFDDHFMDRYEDRFERRMSRLHHNADSGDDDDDLDDGLYCICLVISKIFLFEPANRLDG